jgi:hypothetical protein
MSHTGELSEPARAGHWHTRYQRLRVRHGSIFARPLRSAARFHPPERDDAILEQIAVETAHRSLASPSAPTKPPVSLPATAPLLGDEILRAGFELFEKCGGAAFGNERHRRGNGMQTL